MKDLHEQVSKSRKVALYVYMGEHPWYAAYEVSYSRFDEHYDPLPNGELREEPRKGFTRVSEPVEVSFTALSDDSVIQQAVASLNEAEREVLRELNEKLTKIRAQKASLLALTHQPESV